MEWATQVERQPVWLGQSWKMINFISKKISDQVSMCIRGLIVSVFQNCNQASPVSVVAHSHKMPIQVCQPVKGD